MGRVKSVGFHQHIMRRRQKVAMMGLLGELKRRSNQLGARHDLAVLTRLTAPRGKAFVKKSGVPGIFIRLLFRSLTRRGPLRCWDFRNAVLVVSTGQFSSAFVWAAVLLTLGNEISKIFRGGESVTIVIVPDERSEIGFLTPDVRPAFHVPLMRATGGYRRIISR
jgi:hypothetical protein